MIKPTLLIALFSFFTIFSQSQERYENWSSLEFDYSIAKNVDIYVGTQLRIKSVGEIYNQSFYEIGLKFKINDFIRSGFGFRGIDKLQDVGNSQLYKKFMRYYRAFLTGSYNYKQDIFRLRLQFQRLNEIVLI